MRFRVSIALAGCLLVLSAWLRVAHAQQMESREGIALQNQIYQLEQEIESLRQQGPPRGGGSSLGGYRDRDAPVQQGPSSGLVAQLLSRVNTLEDQVRDLRGRIDELENQSQQQSADLAKQLSDLKFQLQNGGAAAVPPSGGGGLGPPGDGGLAPSGGPPPGGRMTGPSRGDLGPAPGRLASQAAEAPRAPAVPGQRTPEVAMHAGYAALAQRNYQSAEASARYVLNNNRTSPRAYDAQFLLAQALAGEHQYSQAAIAYDDVYNRSRKGVHAAAALVGLANQLASINEKRAACETLLKLHAEFPQSASELRPQIAAVHERAGCP